MRNYGPMRGVSGLAGLVGGNLGQQAGDMETERLLKQDLARSQMDLYGAQSGAATSNARQKVREVDLAEAMQRANLDARARRADPTFLSQNAAYRLGVPRETIELAMREGAAAGLNPEQMRLLGETIAALHASSTESAEKGSGVGDIADLMAKSGMSAQRLAAPDILRTDPNRAAFTLAAGTDSAPPSLYSGMQTGIGTIGNFSGEQRYDPGLYQSRIAKERADANQSNAAAASSSATAARTRQQIDQGNRLWDADRGGFVDWRTGAFVPATNQAGAPVGPKPHGNIGGVTINTKPLPVGALRLQQDDLEAIGIASAIDADLGVIEQQLAEGGLDLGPIDNLVNRGRNALGMSTEQSRNFQSFQSTLEKMRNDSLRLNKGVQTEGDAVRAWNELMANQNDPGVVRQRLAEIRAINRRAADLRRMSIDTLRANYGAAPLDTSGHENVPAAVGARPAAPASGIPTIQSDAEFDALPSGAEFVGPDGVRRRKP